MGGSSSFVRWSDGETDMSRFPLLGKRSGYAMSSGD
jgi:hypothetical protein